MTESPSRPEAVIRSSSPQSPTSSTAPKGAPQKMYEKTAFKPCDNKKHMDTWPQFELTNATVRNKKRSGGLEDLLDVGDHGPFEVRGTLSKIPNKHMGIVRVRPASRIYNTPLCIKDVYTNSIEDCEDGTIKIWALGSSGWFSILPSEEYKPIFDNMLEKARLWFFIQDKYDEYFSKADKVSGTVEELFAGYVGREPSCPDKRAVIRLFDKHHRYLILKMCSGDVKMWEQTPLFHHYRSKYASEFPSTPESAAGAEAKEAVNYASTNEGASAAASLRSRTPPPTGDRHPVYGNSISCRIFKRLHHYVNVQKLRPSDVTKDRIIRFLNEVYVFDSSLHTARYLDARASDMLSLMDRPPARVSFFDWVKTPAYKELEAVTKSDSDGEVRKEKLIERSLEHYVDNQLEDGIGVQGSTTARMPVKPQATGAPTKTLGGNDDSDSEFEDGSQRKRRSAKGKSSLRPSFTPAPLELPSPSKSIDEDTPTTLLLNRKRTFDHLVSPSVGAPPAKYSRIRTTNSSSSLNTTPMDPTTSGLRPGSARATLVSTPPQIVGPNRPGGHWECEIDGCKHCILDASDTENLKLIEQHYEEHGRIMRQAMEVIGKEVLPNRSGHHVDNLLAKIEDMAKKWAMSKPAPLTALELGFMAPATSSSSSTS